MMPPNRSPRRLTCFSKPSCRYDASSVPEPKSRASDTAAAARKADSVRVIRVLAAAIVVHDKVTLVRGRRFDSDDGVTHAQSLPGACGRHGGKLRADPLFRPTTYSELHHDHLLQLGSAHDLADAFLQHLNHCTAEELIRRHSLGRFLR